MQVENEKRPRRWRRWVALVLLGCLVLFLGLWFGPSPAGVRGPVRMVRGEDGRLVPQDGEVGDGSRLEVQAGKLEAHNQMTSGSSTSSSDHSRFAARRLLILGLSDHALMQRVAGELLERLKQMKYVEQIEYFPAGHNTQQGGRGADAFITLDLEKLSESGWLSENIDAEIMMTASGSPAPSNYHSTDHLTPPVLDYSWKAQLHHRSKRIGVGSSAARYKLQAEDIAKQLSTSLIKQFDEWRAKYGELPELPAEFYPAYREAPKLPLEKYSPKLLSSHSALWIHNETVWQCESERKVGVVLPELEKKLQEQGWKTDEITVENPVRLAMKKDQISLAVWAPNGLKDGEQGNDRFVVRTRERISPAARDALVAKLVDDAAPMETLLLFERHWQPELRERVLTILEKEPWKSPETWLATAKLQRPGDEAEAKRSLQKAQALAFSMPNSTDLAGRIKAVAKQFGDEKLVDEPVDAALLPSAGFVEWPIRTDASSDPGQESAKFDADRPLLLFHLDGEGKLYKYCLRVTESAAAGEMPIECIMASPGVQSRSSGMVVTEKRPGTFHWTLPTEVVQVGVSKVASEPALEATFARQETKPSESGG